MKKLDPHNLLEPYPNFDPSKKQTDELPHKKYSYLWKPRLSGHRSLSELIVGLAGEVAFLEAMCAAGITMWGEMDNDSAWLETDSYRVARKFGFSRFKED